MKSYNRVAERAALMTIGTALCIMALVLIALGVTWLPVIGILFALPVMGFAFSCFRSREWTIASEETIDAHDHGSDLLAA